MITVLAFPSSLYKWLRHRLLTMSLASSSTRRKIYFNSYAWWTSPLKASAISVSHHRLPIIVHRRRSQQSSLSQVSHACAEAYGFGDNLYQTKWNKEGIRSKQRISWRVYPCILASPSRLALHQLWPQLSWLSFFELPQIVTISIPSTAALMVSYFLLGEPFI